MTAELKDTFRYTQMYFYQCLSNVLLYFSFFNPSAPICTHTVPLNKRLFYHILPIVRKEEKHGKYYNVRTYYNRRRYLTYVYTTERDFG